MPDKLIAAILTVIALLFLLFADLGPQARVYDCGMAEWHPDIPKEVKEECRKMRQEHFQQQQIERKTIST
jgi:hypothetical protein